MADNDFTSEDLAALEKHDKEIAEEFSKELHAGCAELQKQLIEKYAPAWQRKSICSCSLLLYTRV
jgi:hypothetical protein